MLQKTPLFPQVIRENIAELAAEFRAAAAVFGRHLPDDHSGKAYLQAMPGYARRINQLERDAQEKLNAVGAQITSLSGTSWQKDKEIVQLWLHLANALTPLSEHSTKGVSSLIVSEDNRLQSYGVNRVPEGIRKKRGRYYQKGIRKNYIICAEREALARFYGIKIDPWWRRSRKLSRDAIDEIVRHEIAGYSRRIMEIGRNSDRLRTSVMISSAPTCDSCEPVLGEHRLHQIFVIKGAGRHFTRSAGFMRAQASLMRNGTNVRRIALG